jgi:ribose 5-phosphate isomerase B
MRIALAADHRGHALKEKVHALLNEKGHEVIDMGTNSSRSCDYPDMGFKAAKAVAETKVDRGILVCGTGIGMSITANKVPGVRAALCLDELTAQLSRSHNDANVLCLCLAADVIGEERARHIVERWLETSFEDAGRHARRVWKINCIERGQDPAKQKFTGSPR